MGDDAPMLVKNAVPVPKDITDDKVGGWVGGWVGGCVDRKKNEQ